MNITNMGTIIGSLLFSGRGDTFNAVTGSSVTGTIDGGGGNDKLTLSGSGSGVMSSVLANWETVTKTDSGTWTLTANNTYSGTTSVNAGTRGRLDRIIEPHHRKQRRNTWRQRDGGCDDHK